MSTIKKAIKVIAENKEYFLDQFMAHEKFQNWLKEKPKSFYLDYQFAIQDRSLNRSCLTGFLKSNPQLTKAILSKPVLNNIQPWYEEHPGARYEKAERLQNLLIDKLNKICNSYKKYLHNIIDTEIKAVPKKPRQLDFDVLHKSFSPENRELPLPTQSLYKKEEIDELTGLQKVDNPKQNYRLNTALMKYRVVTQLQYSLQTQGSLRQKLSGFHTAFNEPKNQLLLNQANDSAGLRFLKAIGHLLTFGLVSKFTKGTFKFWKDECDVLNEKLQTQSIHYFISTPGLC